MKYDSSYFLRYYGRYFPSRKRLYQKIDMRVSDPEVARLIREQLEPYIVEERILEDRVQSLVQSGKRRYDICSNLVSKGFERADIERVILACEMFGDRYMLEDLFSKKIQAWITQNKSRKEIQQKLFSMMDKPEVM